MNNKIAAINLQNDILKQSLANGWLLGISYAEKPAIRTAIYLLLCNYLLKIHDKYQPITYLLTGY